MPCKNLFVIFVVFVVGFVHIIGQELCRPNRVDSLTLTADSILVWTPPANEDCAISHYLVDIHNGVETEYVFLVKGTVLSVKFLPVCEKYRFTVTPISTDDVEGVDRLHYEKMPLPLDANLSVVLFKASPHDLGVFLEWKVDEKWEKCADHFRLSVYDGQSDAPVDIYLYSNFVTITKLVPCTTYQFGIRAIYNMAIEGPYIATQYPTPAEPMAPPTLISVKVNATTADLVWKMETLLENRCSVSSVTINASPSFTISFAVRDQGSRAYFPTRLTGLHPDILYVLNVTATNTAGVSGSAFVGIQTLESN